MKIKTKYLKALFIAFYLVHLSACAVAPQSKINIDSGRVPQGATVGTIWISPCSTGRGCRKSSEASTLGEFVPTGANGLLIYGAVLSAHQEIIDALDTISSKPIVEDKYSQPVKNLLESASFSFSVSTNNDHLYAGDLKALKRHSIDFTATAKKTQPRNSGVGRRLPIIVEQTDFDLSAVADSMDVDYLAVLEVHLFNLRRKFGPFALPLTEPHGMGLVRLSLIDTQNGERVFDDWGFGEKFVASGEWRQRGNWSNVLTITQEALELAIDRAMESFSKALNGSGPT